jgi:UPF0755 protein
MDRRKILIVSIVVVTILLSSFTFYFYQVVYAPNFLVEKESRAVIIPFGSSFEDVQKIIYDQGFVNEPVAFGLLAKLMKYNRLVKPGKFLIEKNSSNLEVIRKLRSGDQVPVRVTFNNSRLIEDVAEKITINIGLNASEFLEYIKDSSTAARYDFDAETFRCMFIPNTYEVYWTITRKELVDRLYKEYQLFWNEQRKAKAKEIDLAPVEVSILASIVQAEVSHHDESPVVAGLYLNRLKRSMPLQADPTLVYAAGDFTIQRVLNVHKEIESPYNTYKHAGLPPGPINFPSIISIDAVLNHQENNYLYMCAREDFSGYHNFSSSLRQHNINARKYQQALNKAKLYK